MGDGTWMPTILGSVMAAVVVAFTGALGYLSRRLDREAAARHTLSDTLLAKNDVDMGKLWTAMDALRLEHQVRFDALQRSLRDFADTAAAHRERLLATAVTKDDLERTMNHFVALLDARMNNAPKSGAD